MRHKKDDVDAQNIYENYYLYDKTSCIFKIDTILSALLNLNFDFKNKKIPVQDLRKRIISSKSR